MPTRDDDRAPFAPGTVPLDVQFRERPGRPSGPRAPGGWPGGGPGAIGGQYTIAPPWIDRPPTAVDFQLQDELPAATNVNTPAFFPLDFTIPRGQVGVIRSVAILANNLLTTSDIRWAIFIAGSPVTGWNNLTINPRAAGSVELTWTPDETAIPVDEGARIQVRVAVIDAGTYQVGVSLHGWFYGQDLDTAARRAYGFR